MPSATLRLGADLPVHRLGHGAIRLTGPGTWGDPPDRDGAVAVPRRAVECRAVECGADLVDTAEAYGPFTNEELIRDALHPYDGVTIATRGGGVRPGQWHARGRPEFPRQGVETTPAQAARRPLSAAPRRPAGGACRPGRHARRTARGGKIRHIGLCEAGVAEIEAARAVTGIAAVQNRYSIADRGRGDVRDHCAGTGIAFLAWNPLGGGDLGSLGPLDAVEGLAAVPVPVIALAWLLHRSPAMIAVPGTATPAHAGQNMRAATLEPTPGQLHRLSTMHCPQ